jgi:hypothetical protein
MRHLEVLCSPAKALEQTKSHPSREKKIGNEKYPLPEIGIAVFF